MRAPSASPLVEASAIASLAARRPIRPGSEEQHHIRWKELRGQSLRIAAGLGTLEVSCVRSGEVDQAIGHDGTDPSKGTGGCGNSNVAIHERASVIVRRSDYPIHEDRVDASVTVLCAV